MHLSKLQRIERGFTILVFWWTNIHYWSFPISKNPYFQNEATSKRIKWMNEWMKLFSWQSLHVKDFTMIIDFRKSRLEAIWRWLINNGIWPHSKAYAADISKTWNAFSLRNAEVQYGRRFSPPEK